jgi:hypothetical protein
LRRSWRGELSAGAWRHDPTIPWLLARRHYAGVGIASRHTGNTVSTASAAIMPSCRCSGLPRNLARVNAAARRAVQTRSTALLHNVDAEALERSFRCPKRRPSAGVDGIMVADHEQNLTTSLRTSERAHASLGYRSLTFEVVVRALLGWRRDRL